MPRGALGPEDQKVVEGGGRAPRMPDCGPGAASVGRAARSAPAAPWLTTPPPLGRVESGVRRPAARTTVPRRAAASGGAPPRRRPVDPGGRSARAGAREAGPEGGERLGPEAPDLLADARRLEPREVHAQVQ